MSNTDALRLTFACGPSRDSSVMARYCPRDDAQTERHSIIIEPRGMMAGYSNIIRSDSGEFFRFLMGNLLNVKSLTSTTNEDAEPLSPRLPDEEFLLSLDWPSTNLFPPPFENSPSENITPENVPSLEDKAVSEDIQKMLSLSIELNKNASTAVYNDDSGQAVNITQDICVNVFLNGTFCESRMVTSDTLRDLHYGQHHGEIFQGLKIIDSEATTSEREEQDMTMHEQNAASRWTAINQKLKAATINSSPGSVLQFLTPYTSAVAGLPVPRQEVGLESSNVTYAVMDVVLVGGFKVNASKRQREDSSDTEAAQQAAERMKPLTGAHLPLITDTASSYHQDGTPTQAAALNDLYDDSDEDAETILNPQNDTSMRAVSEAVNDDVQSHSRRSRAPSPSDAGALDSEESEVEMLDEPVRAPETGHISNLLHLKLREERGAKHVAQHPKPRRRRWRHHQILTSKTSIASLHSTSASSSLNSGPSKSAEWPSTSSEIIRLRKTKGDLSLPRKKRRKVRYQSTDFDSEDPVATIPGARDAKIRILEPNSKSDLAIALPSQQGLHDSTAQLVKPQIKRNTRKKRERQYFKRITDVGLTERDMYKYIEADYEARDGVKPWLESLDHEELPVAQSLGGGADQALTIRPKINEGNDEDNFIGEVRTGPVAEQDLMKGSVLSVDYEDIAGECQEAEPTKFRSAKVLAGLRFIFI